MREKKTEVDAIISSQGGHWLYAVGYAVFSLAFVYLNFRIYFPLTNQNNLPLRHLVALFAVFLFFLTLWLFHRLLCRLSDRVIGWMVLFLFALLVLAQVMSIVIFRVTPSWDFGDVITAASQIAVGKPISYTMYFEIYPHNLKPAILIGTFMKLFKGASWSYYFLNVLSISVSILALYFVVKKLWGIRNAAICLLLALLTTPLYLYAPIVYTDTLSLPYPIISLYFYLKWHEAERRGDIKNQLLHFFLLALVSAVGYLVKPVAAIMLFAALGEQCLTVLVRGVKRALRPFILSLLTALLAAIFILGSFYACAHAKGYTKNISKDKAFPYVHWIMMGMNRPYSEGGTSSGYGGFSGADYKYTKIYANKEIRKVADIVRIKERLQKFGLGGYAQFLIKKLEWTWTDPTFYAPEKLGRKPVYSSIFHQWVLPNEEGRHIPYLVIGQAVHGLTLAMMLFGAVRAWCARSMDGFRMVMVLSCLGIMLFLLAWETRSRYLTFMIPIFLVMASDGLYSAFKKVDALFGLY